MVPVTTLAAKKAAPKKATPVDIEEGLILDAGGQRGGAEEGGAEEGGTGRRR